MVTALSAANAYAAVQKAAAQITGGGEDVGATGGGGFAEMLKGVMTQTADATRQAESLMTAHTVGKAELIDVVTAISSAEAKLETVMAVRDQVISAYQEIMRMPI